MAEIKNLSSQLQVVGAGDNFNFKDSVVFYNKRDVNNNIRLGVEVENSQFILTTVDNSGNRLNIVERFKYSDITSPESTDIVDLVNIVNEYIQSNSSVSGSAAVDLELSVHNNTGSTIPKMQAVYISGYDSATGNPEVSPANANGVNTYPVLGLVKQDIEDGESGLVVQAGLIGNLDTSMFSDTDIVYLSNDPLTSGGLTATKPIGTSKVQQIGEVLNSDASTGSIQVIGAGRVNDLPNIPSSQIWVGNSDGVAGAVNVSGDATISNTGVLSVSGLPQKIASGTNTANNDADTLLHTFTPSDSLVYIYELHISTGTAPGVNIQFGEYETSSSPGTGFGSKTMRALTGGDIELRVRYDEGGMGGSVDIVWAIYSIEV